MDGVAINAFGHLGLILVNFAFGTFNKAACTRKEAWVTICYHPNNTAKASLHKGPTSSFHKCQNLQRGLHAAFAKFREMSGNCGLLWDNLRHGGSVHGVNFKFAPAFVVSDTEMHDKLCGKTQNCASEAQWLCCHCDAPLEQIIKPDHPRHLFKKATFDRQNATNNAACFKSMSHHPGSQ
jgi:hypothetical protein